MVFRIKQGEFLLSGLLLLVSLPVSGNDAWPGRWSGWGQFPPFAGESPAAPAPGEGAVRHYYIAAEERSWDFAPTNQNLIRCSDQHAPCSLPEPWTSSHIFPSVRYIEYTDDTFTTPKPQPEWLGILGPIIRAEVGDTLKVHFCNQTATGTYSMHPHGLRYTKDNEGAPYFGANSTDTLPGAGARVPAGQCFDYTWVVSEDSGPGKGDLSSKVWWYHSHVDTPADTSAGLLGPLIITRYGMANADGAPKDVEREFVTAFFIFDKLEGEEAGLMHSINGRLFGNLRGLVAKHGERVRWHVLGMGNEVDLHTPHWHGETVSVGAPHVARRTDVLELLPASMITADMEADNNGEWLYHCHVADHIEAGMSTTFQILP
ncbi:multicopper oxidase domain-containing protein [Nitrosococcus watsonii]|uniref:Ferroxidase n=1 Tax=Nitrosococcus watsoni (strain C-113) TaxID=105559 RepID=D8KAF6_NITWC|nr:multicopper oxidase domain-containing protein [Nitrosococcus watsonii]ADJ27471.1 Ferroxidase [Nitrosococcus watsonii C-113]